jgi:flavin-dependent dehydrogenase
VETIKNYDLIVVGGGPAGTAAAITAARDGARVFLVERGQFPRHKVCGEFVSAESLGLLEALLDSEHVALLKNAVRIPGARLYLDGRTLKTAIHPPAASIARLDLDAALWHSAERAGVDVRQRVTVRSVSGTGPFCVMTTAGDFETLAVINASGRWSNLNPPPAGNGNRNHGEKWLGLKAHFAEASPEPSVDLYFFAGGYCGVQPVNLDPLNLADETPKLGRVNASAMVRADVASSLSEVLARHPLLHERSRKWLPLTDPVSTSPLAFRDPQPVGDGMLMAGDAVAFVDPFVGDGISLALRSGALAAQCLVAFFQGQNSLAEVTYAYDEAYRERLASVFRSSSRIRRLLGLPSTLRKPVLSVLEKAPAVTEYLVRKTR